MPYIINNQRTYLNTLNGNTILNPPGEEDTMGFCPQDDTGFYDIANTEPIQVSINGSGTNYSFVDFTAYNDQDIDGTLELFEPDLSKVKLNGNTWKKIDLVGTVIATTNLSFEFKSRSIQEGHGIMVETDNTGTAYGKMFQLAGSVQIGSAIRDFDYTTPGEWQTFNINIGSYANLLGAMNFLVFVCNHDVATPTAESQFRNIALTNLNP